MRRVLPILLTLLVLAGLIKVFRFAQQFDPTQGSLAAGAMPDVSIQLQGAIIVSRSEGSPEWSLTADRIDVRRPEFGGLESYSGVDLKNIRTGKLYREGKLEATFSARAASYVQSDAVFNIEGPLKLVSVDGDRLEADTCVWAEKADEVRLGNGVKAVIQGQRLSSPFVLYSPRKRLVNCPQGAEGAFDEISVRASNLVWDVGRGTVDCKGPVSGETASQSWSAQSALVELVVSGRQKDARSRVKRLTANDGNAQVRIEGDTTDLGVRR